ncbi:FAD-dependent oxidoreductase [Paenibacillus thiaminolyticus]|uniref:FAD-binding oxidoreductase n=1 Tax=Paenibacillus thiaminolyticus TaxID=49283 RepID=A0A3A3GKP8_PANTH|nr:FAD-dependent oxidoreductase [Paenibacillus thiaminolyticus]RJG24956.1 FAD-binding oxidoreductase [Paenibacillus thiaminolyticus]
MRFDYVIFGAGIYGLYAAHTLAKRDMKIAIVEYDSESIQRASYINQARVHNGYHYPRSVSTAEKSASYYERFVRDFSFAINDRFKKIYAISSNDSLTNAEQFLRFCEYVNIPAHEVSSKTYFNPGTVEATFETVEYTYDAAIIRSWYKAQFEKKKNVQIFYNMKLDTVERVDDGYILSFMNGVIIHAPSVLNATYASTNQILEKFKFELFKTKYEICEVILMDVSENFKNIGVTVMDGPFFSIMPFGETGSHSLTSVGHTPHESCYDSLPSFSCQAGNDFCTPNQLANCNTCISRPQSAWNRMHQLSKKYLIPEIKVTFKESLFAVKALISASELDDSRPTIIKEFSKQPSFISVFSGKFNTIYDLEEVL